MLKAMHPRWREISWEQAFKAASPTVADVLERALAERDLNFDDGLALCGASADDLLAVLKIANELRRRAVGDQVTYVVNRNLNFTNVCIVGCAFCGFSRGPNSPDAYFHSTETLLAKCVEAVEHGATEVCIQGGLPKTWTALLCQSSARHQSTSAGPTFACIFTDGNRLRRRKDWHGPAAIPAEC